MPKEKGTDDKNSSCFGGRDKSRGIKHQKDKSKYKPKSVKDPKYVPHKQLCNLGSNWDRYEAEEDPRSSKLTSSTDFLVLACAPLVQGQHFQFKQDKMIDKEIYRIPQELFSLDLNMLKCSVLTVPFYKRVGISEEYFSENQISYMNRNAEDSVLGYSEKYHSKMGDEYIQEVSLNTSNNAVSQSENVSDSVSVGNAENEKLTELVCKMDNMLTSETKKTSENSEEDLEQWLDDILDE